MSTILDSMRTTTYPHPDAAELAFAIWMRGSSVTETIFSGDHEYEAVWLHAHLRRSKKEDLVIAELDVPDLTSRPVFYLDDSVIRNPGSVGQAETAGEVKVFLIRRRPDGKLVVLVPGEAVSFGPQLVVPEELAA